MIQLAAELTCLCNMNRLKEVTNNICQTKVCTLVFNSCEASVWNLLHVILIAPRLGVSRQNKRKKINQYRLET